MSEYVPKLPPELRAFLHSCIESLEQVELLMMLRGSDRFRTAREVASERGSSTTRSRDDLEKLAARGLLAQPAVGAATCRARSP